MKKKKAIRSIILISGLIVFVVAAVFLGISLNRIINTQTSVAPTAPESRPQAAGETPKTTTVVVQPIAGGTCEFPTSRTLKDGAVTGMSQHVQQFSVDCEIVDGRITTPNISNTTDPWLYDDLLYFAIDEKIVIIPKKISELSGVNPGDDVTDRNGFWSKIGGVQYGGSAAVSQEYKCIGYNLGDPNCVVPVTRNSGTVTTPFPQNKGVDIKLSKASVEALLDDGRASHTFAIIATGDNEDQTDCRITQPVTLVINQLCGGSTPTPTFTPIPTPTSTTTTTWGNACTVDIAIATATPTPTPTTPPTPTPTPRLSCNNTCTTDSQCADGLSCSSGSCRNPLCTNDTNCVCDVPVTPTPTIIASVPTPTTPRLSNPTPTPTPVPTALPDAGLSLPTIGALGGGIVMILLGLLLAL